MFSAPEGEWFESRGPLKLEILDETTNGIEEGLLIPVPRSVARRHGLKAGEKLSAEYVRGNLVIRRKSPKRARRSA
jgi:hypothetical protein